MPVKDELHGEEEDEESLIGQETSASHEKGVSDSNIKIFLRIKPSRQPSGFFSWNEDISTFKYEIPKDCASGLVNNTRTNYNFRFDTVIGVDSNQEEVFDRVGQPCVENALNGFNSTVFAYGQTGSGKTFTITGGAERYEDRGMIPRALSMVFDVLKKHPERQLQIYISYLEIYNNQGYDLLDPKYDSTKTLEDLPRVSMLEDEDGNCHLRNLSMHHVHAEEDALNLLFLGDTNRAVSETPMNLASSRSHCIFTISLESRRAASSEIVLRSKLHLVDLAGSERAHKTGAKGQLLKEAAYINTSLHYLEMVIVALQEKNTKGRMHIPYRNSMMTSVLRDSLGGNCKTVMVATVSAEKEQTDESISTCRFAQRVARVKNDARLNEELDPQVLIRTLRSQVATLQEELAILKGDVDEGEELKAYELDKLRQKCLAFVNDTSPNARLSMGDFTYTKMRNCFDLMKDIARSAGSIESNSSMLPASGNQHTEQRVHDLEQLVLQRDNEIAIMVNMIRERDPKAGAQLHNKLHTQIETMPQPPPSYISSFKVDSAILDDPAKAFQAFREQYPKNDAIQQNKSLLKQKYDRAKLIANQVNDSRNHIKSITIAIEKLRKQQAIAQQGLMDSKSESETEKKIASLAQEEAQLKSTIDTHKAQYKSGFNELNELKIEIQHLQKILEMSRVKLQKDFDLWYQKQGKSLLMAESIATCGITKSLQSEAKETLSDVKKSHLEENAKSLHGSDIDLAPLNKSSMNASVSSLGTSSTVSSVEDDVGGFYEALDILKRRNRSRKY